jgi:hypothetical protein
VEPRGRRCEAMVAAEFDGGGAESATIRRRGAASRRARREGKIQEAVAGRAKWIVMLCAASHAAYVAHVGLIFWACGKTGWAQAKPIGGAPFSRACWSVHDAFPLPIFFG